MVEMICKTIFVCFIMISFPIFDFILVSFAGKFNPVPGIGRFRKHSAHSVKS